MSTKKNMFKMGDKPKPNPEVDNKGFNINPWVITSFALVISIIALITVKSVNAYDSWKTNWDAVVFAKDNPELVRNIKTQYDNGVAELKQDLFNPKELSQ